MKYYFVYCGQSSIETEVIKDMQPPRLMLSHHYWKHKDLGKLKTELGYEPEIFYDSGAYSAYNSGAKIELEAYLADLDSKMPHITKYMTLDALGDNEESFSYYARMVKMGYNPVPVFQYEHNLDTSFIDQYIELGENFIALGGTVPIKDRYGIRNYVKMLCWLYPEIDFHLLGSGSKPIIDMCDLASADASTWILAACAYGKPTHIKGKDREARINRAKYNMQAILDITS